ncbi:DUF397 domain-containing protein [Kitasatospora sp. NPDC006697]|uniref:DUF397 domain-containing protein n=1 Tax=Kitasatospora sp. NPDC006697 TaxID=3364020 RepID=UPI0036AD3E34
MIPELSGASWFKSSYSNNGGECVEVSASFPGAGPVRDSKNPAGPALVFTAEGFNTFIQGVKNGAFFGAFLSSLRTDTLS